MIVNKLEQMLKVDEGLRLKPYKDTVGKTTIGYGRNLDDRGITLEEAEKMLYNDILEVIKDLDMGLPFWKYQTENRRVALANMCYNLGLRKLMGFHNMIKHMREKEYQKASDEALNSKWAKQVGNRAIRIANLIREG